MCAYNKNSKMILNIESWNAIILDNTSNRYPSVYVKPTEEFKNFISNLKSNSFSVKISGTDTIYDNVEMDAHVYNSINTPNYRPNFYMKNGYFTLLLNHTWLGYPCSLGRVEIYE